MTIEVNYLQYSGSRMDNSEGYNPNLSEDESNRSSATKSTSKTGQLQSQGHKGTNVGLHSQAMSEKVTQDPTLEEAGNDEQAHNPNNLRTGFYGNGIQTDIHHPYENLYKNYRNFLETVS